MKLTNNPDALRSAKILSAAGLKGHSMVNASNDTREVALLRLRIKQLEMENRRLKGKLQQLEQMLGIDDK